MLPSEQFSGDATKGPPWTPAVWTKGPDQLVNDARLQLFDDRAEIERGALGSSDTAIAGTSTGSKNETDQVIPASPVGRGAAWQSSVRDLYATEPRLAGWSEGDKTGEVNPAP